MTENTTGIPPLKRELLSETFPAAACTPELLHAAQAYADSEHISVSAVVRHAVAIFLKSVSANSVETTENTLVKEPSHE